MSGPRVIRKYPNRRLYDTVDSRYVTLREVRRLVLDEVDFVILDKKSGEDITRTILLQVIAEQENGGEPVMSRDFLSKVIRSYGHSVQGLVGTFLDQSMGMFLSQQQQLRERVRSLVGVDALGPFTTLAEKNVAQLKAMQERLLSSLPGAQRAGSRESDD
jgi:polyhydroxyalkanoate synthesis repressor PhaR